jgi:peptide/nickel transport system substrate-binding protein
MTILFLISFALLTGSVLWAQDATPQRGGTVRAACVAAITSLDPQTSQLGICDGTAYLLLYNRLVALDDQGNITPQIATEWMVSDDGLTYTFTLREGVTFHDGTPVNAEAVKFSLDRVRDPESPSVYASRLAAISEINVIDDTTVEIILSQINIAFLPTLTASGWIVSPTAVEAFGEDFAFNAVGSGPFRLVSWTPGDVAVFERNPDYWEAGADGEPLPYLDGVELVSLEDETVRFLNTQSGEFQLNERISLRDVAAVESSDTLQLLTTASSTAYAVTFNSEQPPFDNLALRQAVQMALDDEAIIENLSLGTGYTSSFPFPREAWYFQTATNPDTDLDRARELLAEAGYPDGLSLTLTHISRPIDAQLAQIVQAQLAQIGITVEIQALERTAWLDIWLVNPGENTEGQLAVFQNTVSLDDPDGKAFFVDPNSTVNFGKWNNPDAWQAVLDARATADPAERAALWNGAVEMLIADAGYVWLGNVPVVGAAISTLQGLELAGGAWWSLTSAWLEQGQ